MANNTMARSKEEWRPVVGFEDYYQVSNNGRVRRIAPCNMSWFGRVLRPALNTSGYPMVGLSVHAQHFGRMVHQLVAQAFLGPAPAGTEVNHKDANKANNRLDNLEYVTRKENIHHSMRMGLTKRGVDITGAKLTPEKVLAIREACLAANEMQKDIAKRFGVHKNWVGVIHRRKAWAWLP